MVLLESVITCIMDLKADGCPSKEIEKQFGQSALLMNATYIVFLEGDL